MLNMPKHQENICKVIDQRNKDKMVVWCAELSLEPPQLFWVGIMSVSNRFIKVVLC